MSMMQSNNEHDRELALILTEELCPNPNSSTKHWEYYRTIIDLYYCIQGKFYNIVEIGD